MGFYIIIHTSRNMRSYKGNIGLINNTHHIEKLSKKNKIAKPKKTKKNKCL